jgi:serine/threonine protein kinase/formylglycine-generating enzyme required for sulfatase activity
LKPDDWQRVKEIHAAAMELPPEEREAWVARACAGEPELLREVRQLLSAPEDADFLEPPGSGEEAREAPQWLGDFEIFEEIGRGGMGIVYRARQTSLNREVAVKLLPRASMLKRRHIERFHRETLAAAKLHHPAIVPIHAVGREAGIHYFAMDYVAGRSLNAELELLRDELNGKPVADRILPPFESREYITAIAQVCAKIAEALQFAHAHGVVHRDVKPHNILLDRSGTPFVVDFGLAKVEELGSLTHSGEIAGTPYYMSPEQALAKRVKIDHRTDVFSLGVVLYEALSLHRPFEGSTSHEILYAITFRVPKRLRRTNPRVPRDLETVCEKAMAKSPEERYASAGELADELTRFLNHLAIHTQPVSYWKRLVQHVEHRRNWYVPSAVMAAVLVACVPALMQWAERRDLELQLRPLREILASEVPDDRPIAELSHGLEQARDLRRRGLGRSVTEPAIARIEAVARGKKERGLARLQRGLAPPQDTPLDRYRAASDRDYFVGLGLLREALMLLPDDPELQLWTDPRSAYPQLEFAPDPLLTGAAVHLQAIDWLTQEVGDPVLLGVLPMQDPRPVEPGLYRITVVRDGSEGPDTCEMTRNLDLRGRVYSLRPVLRSSQEVVAGMVRVPADTYTVRDSDDPRRLPVFLARSVELPSFWIDAYEVTNAEYDLFLDETGRDPPAYWADDERPGWDALPVVGVSFVEAQAYAEWAGKRLPTGHEWAAAARGKEGRPYPWGAEPGALTERAVLGKHSDPFDWRAYARSVLPPGSRPEDVSPFGLFDVLGNVSEWTESIGSTEGEDRDPRPDFGSRIARGAHWKGPIFQGGPGLDQVCVFPVVAQVEYLGFRCAKSAWPRSP